MMVTLAATLECTLHHSAMSAAMQQLYLEANILIGRTLGVNHAEPILSAVSVTALAKCAAWKPALV